MAGDSALADVFAELGFRSDAAQRDAMAALVAAGLTTGRKARIPAAKLDAVRATLAARFVVACARQPCRTALAADPRTIVDAAQPGDCTICHGSANEPAVDAAIDAMRARGLARLVVVGGSPATHEELRTLVAARLQLRVVDGTERRTGSDAKADLAWADLVVIWGSTQLDHKTSRLYTAAHADHVVTCGKRGIAALAATILAFAQRR